MIWAFRPASELPIAQAVDDAGVFFIPCTACWITVDAGGDARELDFFVVHEGIPGVLELDGAPHADRAADDPDDAGMLAVMESGAMRRKACGTP